MKLVCTQENLKRAIGYAERVTGRQSSLPILGNFLLETESGRLKLSATNLEIGVVARVGAKVEREGSLTVPAKILSQFVVNLPETEVVTLEEKDQALSVSCAGYRVKIKGLPASEFPIMPQKKAGVATELPAEALKRALSRLLPCVATQETRLELTGVNFLFEKERVRLAATDSFRLSEEILPFSAPLEAEVLEAFSAGGSLILPSTTLLEVSRAIGVQQKMIRMTLEENQIFSNSMALRYSPPYSWEVSGLSADYASGILIFCGAQSGRISTGAPHCKRFFFWRSCYRTRIRFGRRFRSR
ncbi:MAG: DNA polymerase III subunit beta [Candidatus Moraniibacteriota bacterium]|nr:MAG: DNA polymerase III subunit beta [Candidatus Moranbacteria bacterium]